MLEKGLQQVWPLMFAEHGSGHLVSEVVKGSGNAVGQLAIFGMSPDMIDHINTTRMLYARWGASSVMRVRYGATKAHSSSLTSLGEALRSIACYRGTGD